METTAAAASAAYALRVKSLENMMVDIEAIGSRCEANASNISRQVQYEACTSEVGLYLWNAACAAVWIILAFGARDGQGGAECQHCRDGAQVMR